MLDDKVTPNIRILEDHCGSRVDDFSGVHDIDVVHQFPAEIEVLFDQQNCPSGVLSEVRIARRGSEL